MRVSPVNDMTFTGYRIKAEENKHLRFLYNNVQDAIKGEGVTTTFTSTEIKFERMTKALREKLEKLKVIFKEDK